MDRAPPIAARRSVFRGHGSAAPGERALQHVGHQSPRVLAARVAGRDDQVVGQRARGAPHRRALGGIDAPRGTGHDHQTSRPARVDGDAHRLRDSRDRRRRVREVDDRVEALALVDRLEAPRRTVRAAQRRSHRLGAEAERIPDGDRGGGVARVVGTGQR